VPVAVLVAAGGVVGAMALPPDTDAVDGDARPTPTSTEAASDGATPTPSGATPTGAPTTPEASTTPEVGPTAGATARAASLSGPPKVDVSPQLAADRDDVGKGLEGLRGRIDRLLAELGPSLAGSDVSVAVRDAEGRRVFDQAADRRMLPASTMKSVTAAMVLSTLGPDHRFTTTVEAAGEVEDGVLRGDLVIRGGGDPVLTTEDYRRHVYPSRPATSIEDLADAVAATGLERVTGRLLGDDGGWGNSELAAGWREGYIADQNARRIVGLTVDAGLTVDVEIPDDAPVQVELHPATDPVRTTADVLAAELAERGVSIRGGTGTARLPVADTTTVAAVESPPVSELLTFTLQRSDNHLADTLVLGAADAATGDGSWAAANRTGAAVLDGLGIDPTGLRVADGSGLSRLDRVTAGQLADLDTAMMASSHAATWEPSLAVAGETGTLKRRLLGTPGAGRFVGKTGTLDDVKAVVGHVRPGEAGGSRLHMAVVANGAPAGGQWAVTVLMDRLALVLADHQDGCRTRWDEEGQPTRTCTGG
jgi:D-alanyl-D-alanine carboxypeptidase/D-alanyl-D-alanine-endopeptidase (penicillin-binding protein 4)